MERLKPSPVENFPGFTTTTTTAGNLEGQTGLKPKETIPLADFRSGSGGGVGDGEKGDILQKIHAHSSAETSGLGDSLQRLHTLSSTETSGYGGGAPSPTGGTLFDHSPEQYTQRSPNSVPLPKLGVNIKELSPRSKRQHFKSVPRSVHYDGSEPFDKYEETGFKENPHCKSPRPYGSAHSYIDSYDPPETTRNPHHVTPSDSRDSRSSQRRNSKGYAQFHEVEQEQEDDMNKYFERANRRGSYTPIGSLPSSEAGSTNSLNRKSSVDGYFLGKSTQSTWLKWSEERRESFKRRLDSIEQRQRELEKNRVPTPVRKARKESVMFVSPKLEDQHIIRDELLEQSERIYQQVTVKLPPKPPRKGGRNHHVKEEVKISVNQWNTLVAFWEHKIFVKSRYAGLLLSTIAVILGITCLSNSDWYHHEGKLSFPSISYSA